jgi:plastocyanin
MNRLTPILFCSLIAFISCGDKNKKQSPVAEKPAPPLPSYFKPDPATAGVLTGTIEFTGKKPAPKRIDMSDDPACVEAHRGKPYDQADVVNPNHTLSNVFVYVKSGLEGKKFEVSATPATIDQHGCWFNPRVVGLQTGQILRVVNSDPVTHNIHPLAQLNREWNHSQGPGDPPLARKFVRPEVMIPVKCNIHRWMHAFIGVVDHPYFAVSGPTGKFEIRNVPLGNYVIEAWHESLGAQERNVSISPAGTANISFSFKAK